MSDEFFLTMMGRRHYEGTMPKIAEQLERLNKNLEAIVVELKQSNARAAAATERASSQPE